MTIAEAKRALRRGLEREERERIEENLPKRGTPSGKSVAIKKSQRSPGKGGLPVKNLAVVM